MLATTMWRRRASTGESRLNRREPIELSPEELFEGCGSKALEWPEVLTEGCGPKAH